MVLVLDLHRGNGRDNYDGYNSNLIRFVEINNDVTSCSARTAASHVVWCLLSPAEALSAEVLPFSLAAPAVILVTHDVKTENAAKPAAQALQSLTNYISQLERVTSSFDCGYGKLRYVGPILSSSETLTVVDSEVQIARIQSVQESMISVRDVARRPNRIIAANTLEFSNGADDFER